MKALKIEEHSRAASVIGCSEDLIPQILIHLSPKSLFRFKLVSKQWKSHISDQRFIIQYCRKSSNAPCGMFVYNFFQNWRLETVSIPLFGNPSDSVPPLAFLDHLPREFSTSDGDILSCKGLLLCLFFKRNFTDVIDNLRCIVCNPSTRNFKVLPTFPYSREGDWFDGLTMLFNPLESLHYKVLGIKRNKRLSVDCPKICIYSSETNSWKFGRVIDRLERRKHRGVFWNDTVYWIGQNRMHYYNVNSEEVGSLDMPFPVCWRSCYFAESCGHLYLAFTSLSICYSYIECRIFEFNSSIMQWSVPRVEVLDSNHFGGRNVPKYTSELAVAKGENDTDFLLLSHASTRLIISDLLLHRQVEELRVPRDCRYRACEYIPSLAPV